MALNSLMTMGRIVRNFLDDVLVVAAMRLVHIIKFQADNDVYVLFQFNGVQGAFIDSFNVIRL